MVRTSSFLSSFVWLLFLSEQGLAQPPEEDAAPGGSPPEEASIEASTPTPKSEGIPLKQPTHASEAEEGRAQEKPQPSRPAQGEPSGKPKADKNDDDDDEEGEGEADEESPQFAYFGIGPTMLGIGSYDEYGVALAVGGRFPFHQRMAVNAGLTWGLTSFWRTERWWEEARQVGSWTTRAYGNVTRWAGEGEDDDALRYMAAFYAYIGLLFPYFISGIMYVAGPLAATSYLDFHMEASFHLFETRKGPYVGAGLGTIAFVDPLYGELKGGVGPSLGAGFDFGWFGVEARGFVSPRYLHGESTALRTDVYTGSFLLRVQGR